MAALSLEEISKKLEHFENVEAIMKLRSKYFWCLDNKIWDQWAEIFTEDLEADFSDDFGRMGGENPEHGIMRGRDQFIKAISEGPLNASVISVHKGAMPLIDFTGPNNATGRWQMYDVLDYGEPYILMGYGHYFDEYVKQDGAWKICRFKETRLHTAWHPKQMLNAPMIVSPVMKQFMGL